MTLRKALIGDRPFYRNVFTVVTPIILQNAISNFVSLLDNLMVGKIGTYQMSGVSITNTLLFVFMLCTFGAIAGAGIYGAQFAGAKDNEGIKNTFRFKVLICSVILAVALVLLSTRGRDLISLYLTDRSNPLAVEDTLKYGHQYLTIMLFGLLPFSLTCCHAGTLRESGNALLPMIASICAVFTNLCGNYILIFGHFGFPTLGVAGAAIATVISRFVELGILCFAIYTKPLKYPMFAGVWKTMRIPRRLVKEISIKGTPLLMNECLWSTGMATITKLYSMRGLPVIAGFNISNTIVDLLNVIYMSMGNAAGIIIGQALGANDIEGARRKAWNIISLSLAVCIFSGFAGYFLAPLFPRIYNTSDEVRRLATAFIRTNCFFMPAFAFMHASYFIIRSGGKTIITFLFDCGFTWAVSLPIAAALIYLTNLPIETVYLFVLSADVIKDILAFILIKKGVWIHNIIQ